MRNRGKVIMPIWIVPPAIGLIEPSPAPEFFTDNVGAIELIGDYIRVFYCTEQLPLEVDMHAAQRVVAVKIVRPITAIPDAISRLAMCLRGNDRALPVNGPRGPRLVTE